MLESRRLAVLVFMFTATVFFLLFTLTLLCSFAEAGTIYVDDDAAPGGDGSLERPFTTIQKALNASENGDEIQVLEGNYQEDLVVEKSISLVGNDSGSTRILASAGHETSLELRANRINVTGFTLDRKTYVPDSKRKGILITGDNCRILDCRIYNYYRPAIHVLGARATIIKNSSLVNYGDALLVENAEDTTILNSSITPSVGSGIELLGSNHSLVENNWFAPYHRAISLENSHNNIFSRNRIRYYKYATSLYMVSCNGNSFLDNNLSSGGYSYSVYMGDSTNCKFWNNSLGPGGFTIEGETPESWGSHDFDGNNTVNEKPLVYLGNLSGGRMNVSARDIILGACSNMTLEGLNVSDYRTGLQIGFCEGVEIRDSVFRDGNYGPKVYASTGTTFFNVTITGNEQEGVILDSGCQNTSFLDCLIENNQGAGVWLEGTRGTSFQNTMVKNNEEFGIRAHNCTELNFQGLELQNNEFFLNGDKLEHWNTHHITSSCTVNGKPIYYYANMSDFVAPTAAGQIILANCNWVQVEALESSHRSGSLLIGFSQHCSISDNNLSDNQDKSYQGSPGLYLQFSSNNIITGNRCENNLGGGIILQDSQGNHLKSNVCQGNGRNGITLYNSQRNQLTHNIIALNDRAGMALEDSQGNHLESNTLNQNEDYSIQLSSSHGNLLGNNTCTATSNGLNIYLWSSSNNTLMGNRVEDGDDYGMKLDNSHNNTMRQNLLLGNGGVYGMMSLVNSNHNLLENNDFQGEYGAYSYRVIIGGLGNQIKNNSWRYCTGISLSPGAHDTLISGNDFANISWIVNLGDNGLPEGSETRGLRIENNSGIGMFQFLKLNQVKNSTIQNNTVTNCSGGLWLNKLENVSFSDNHFEGNEYSFENGVYLQLTKNCSFENNTITGFETGIYVDIYCQGTEFHGNDIHDNSLFGLYVNGDSSGLVNATDNWWGSKLGPHHTTQNPNGTGNAVYGPVDFMQWKGEEQEIPEEEFPNSTRSGEFPLVLGFLLGLLGLLFGVLGVLVKMPEKPLGRNKKTTAPNSPAAQKEQIEEATLVMEGASNIASCPHCGGGFDLSTVKRPRTFNCYFCGKEISLGENKS